MKHTEVKIHAVGSGDVIFIHGAGMNSEIWGKQLTSLNGIAIDLPNHGKSDGVQVNSVKDYSLILKDFVESLHFEPILVGHSMGGAVLQEYLAMGGRARGAVLVSTAPTLKVNPEIMEKLDLDFEETVKRFVSWMFPKNFEGKKIIEKVCEFVINEGKDVFKQDLILCDKFDLVDRYKKDEIKIRCPVLIVCGNEDRITPPIFSEFLREFIDESKLVFIHGCGHLPMIEKPIEFNKVLKKFYEGLKL